MRLFEREERDGRNNAAARSLASLFFFVFVLLLRPFPVPLLGFCESDDFVVSHASPKAGKPDDDGDDDDDGGGDDDEG